MRKNKTHPHAVSRFPLRKPRHGQHDEEDENIFLSFEEAVDGKRIKLAEFPAENPTSGRLEDSLATEKGTRIQSADGPKTSEYAFFQKLKGKKDDGFQSHVKNRRDNQNNKFKSNDISRESTTNDYKGHNLFSSSLVFKDPSATNFVTLGSTSSRTSKGTVVHLKQAPTWLGNASKQKLTEQFSELPKHGVHATGDIFSRKREKLCKWLKNIHISETKELCSKGQGVVSLLLSRLLPKGNEEKNYQTNLFAQGETLNEAQLPNLSKSKFYLHSSYGKSAEDFMLVQGGQYLEFSSPSHWSQESRETEVPCYDPPAACAKKALTWREMKEDLELDGFKDEVRSFFYPSFRHYGSMSDHSSLDCTNYSGGPSIELEEDATAPEWKWDLGRLVSSYEFPSACVSLALPWRKTKESDLEFGSFKDMVRQTRNDASFYSLSTYYESISDHNINYWDKFHYPGKQSIKLQPKAPVLGWDWDWDFDCWTSEKELSMNCQTKELILYSGSPTSSNNDPWQSHDDPYGAKRFCALSVLPHHAQEFYSTSCPTSHDEYDFAPNVRMSEADVAYWSHSPFYLPSNYTDLIEGCNDRILYGALPHRLSCSTSKAPTEEIYQSDNQECTFFSELDVNPSWKCLSMLAPSVENFVSMSTALQYPQDGEIAASSINGDSCGHLLGDPLQREVLEHSNRGFSGGYGQSLLLYSDLPIDREKAYPLLSDKTSWIELEPKVDDSIFDSVDATY